MDFLVVIVHCDLDRVGIEMVMSDAFVDIVVTISLVRSETPSSWRRHFGFLCRFGRIVSTGKWNGDSVVSLVSFLCRQSIHLIIVHPSPTSSHRTFRTYWSNVRDVFCSVATSISTSCWHKGIPIRCTPWRQANFWSVSLTTVAGKWNVRMFMSKEASWYAQVKRWSWLSFLGFVIVIAVTCSLFDSPLSFVVSSGTSLRPSSCRDLRIERDDELSTLHVSDTHGKSCHFVLWTTVASFQSYFEPETFASLGIVPSFGFILLRWVSLSEPFPLDFSALLSSLEALAWSAIISTCSLLVHSIIRTQPWFCIS